MSVIWNNTKYLLKLEHNREPLELQVQSNVLQWLCLRYSLRRDFKMQL